MGVGQEKAGSRTSLDMDAIDYSLAEDGEPTNKRPVKSDSIRMQVLNSNSDLDERVN